jgi:hypothetical protein
MTHLVHYVFVSLALFFIVNAVNIRILEGIDKKADKDDSKIDYVSPEPMSGPEALSFLSGSCFSSSFDRYEYSICPFQNVTQRRTTAVKPLLIGLWGNWKTTNSPVHTEKAGKNKANGKGNKEELADNSNTAIDTVSPPVDPNYRYFNIMEFPNGRNCGVEGDSVTLVYLQCEHTDFEIISLDSEASCAYTMTLGLPISCNLLRSPVMNTRV